MSTLNAALRLASQGFHVFPLQVNGKLPIIKDYPNRATRDEAQIRKWFADTERNVGISTSKFGEGQALLVVDVDDKNGKRGSHRLLELELEGYDFPVTLEQSTPSGGKHLIYVTPSACKQGVDVLGVGLDTRSRGGYIVGPGSSIDGKPYLQINGHGTMVDAPQWLVDRLGVDRRGPAVGAVVLDGVDSARARDRALAYLETAPLAIEGDGGDITTFRVAAKLKDLGCSLGETAALMAEHWNERCSPPWCDDDLMEKVIHAYRYGREPQGIDAPEAIFDAVPPPPDDEPPALHPLEAMNESYAYVQVGAFVLHETTDEKGNYMTQHLSLAEFHAWHANRLFPAGQKMKPISQVWMGQANRREYERVVFMPQQNPGPRWFNLWRGFRYEPAETSNHPAVAAFLEHALKNVCQGNPDHFRYLMGYFAHLIQRPWEKPLVSLVFKGKKGTGKNALVERVGALLGSHAMVADDDRYLLGNFNSHLESNLLFVLDEAAWAGDKRAEGRLKGLITGTQHTIERKGKEPYKVDNLTRVVILGNEDWLVPATADERRFAVFQLGEGRMQDRRFFQEMREGMERGGYAHLLRYFLDFDLSLVDINEAPATQALLEQKLASMPPLQEWWFDCLKTGKIVGADLGEAIPEIAPTNRVYDALVHWARKRNIRGRLPTSQWFGRDLRQVVPSLKAGTAYKPGPGDSTRAYQFANLTQLRREFEDFIGGTISWE